MTGRMKKTRALTKTNIINFTEEHMRPVSYIQAKNDVKNAYVDLLNSSFSINTDKILNVGDLTRTYKLKQLDDDKNVFLLTRKSHSNLVTRKRKRPTASANSVIPNGSITIRKRKRSRSRSGKRGTTSTVKKDATKRKKKSKYSKVVRPVKINGKLAIEASAPKNKKYNVKKLMKERIPKHFEL